MSVDRALTRSELSGQPIAVAYVDDYEEFGDLAADGLEDACGHLSVTTITDPSTVTDRLDEFDCIVSDYDMPRTDGLELLRQVRVLDDDIPFILFTSDGSETVASDAISLGVTDYLTKSGGQERFVRLANRVEGAVRTKRATEAVQETKHRAKATIERERARFRALIEHSPAMTGVLDESGRFEYVSPSIEDITGYRPREVRGEVAFEYVHEEDRERIANEFYRALSNPEYRPRVEYRFQHENGEWLYLETKGVNRLDDPVIEGFIVNTRDVTEQKQTEKRLRREGDFTERILEVTPTPLLLMDREGYIRRANERAATVFGMDRSDLVGISPAESSVSFRDADGEAVSEGDYLWELVSYSGQPMRDVVCGVTLPSGDYRMSVSAAPMPEPNEELVVVSVDEIDPV